jgi:hypothetical protein
MTTKTPHSGNDTALPEIKAGHPTLDQGCNIKRRTVLTVIPGALSSIAFPGIAATIPKPKPGSEILDLYAKWCAAEAEVSFQADLRGYGEETAKELEAERRAEKLRVKLVQCEPSTMPEIAALTHVLWSSKGYQPEDAEAGIEFGAPMLIAAIWRGASGQEGTPQY